MKLLISFGALLLVLSGCAPKMGKDIVVEPQGNLRWESTKAETIVGVLALLGLPTENNQIRLGTDLKILNKWHSNIKIIALTYTLSDEKGVITEGEAKTNLAKPLSVAAGSEKLLPLEFRLELKRLTSDRVIGILESKRKIFVKGEALIEVWGVQSKYPFEKEATKMVQKALKGYS